MRSEAEHIGLDIHTSCQSAASLGTRVGKKTGRSRARKSKYVTVNDRMQCGYRYELSAPAGRNFDPRFRPELTPRQMLALGVFCGKYMTDSQAEFPRSWFQRAKFRPPAIVH